MASTLKSFSFTRQSNAKFDWKKILDGQIWKLVRGEDFQCKPMTVRSLASKAAKLIGKRVHVSVEDDGSVIVQAYV
jgi:hypothetical protein